jgi:hypothetical protein
MVRVYYVSVKAGGDISSYFSSNLTFYVYNLDLIRGVIVAIYT